MAQEIVEAPITGTIISIDVKVGDKVEEGDILLYIESMKMEIPVVSEDGGVVLEIAVVEGQVVVRPMMNLCLSIDHRVLDGARAARFLGDLAELLETPADDDLSRRVKQLLATIDALVRSEKICANYHLTWFRALNLTLKGDERR